MEVTYTLEAEDVESAIRSSASQRQWLWYWLKIAIVCMIACGTSIYFLLTTPAGERVHDLLPYSPPAVIVLAYAFYSIWSHQRSIRRVSQEASKEVGRRTIRLSESEIYVEDASARSAIEWNAVQRIAQNAVSISIDASTKMTMIIPKRAFMSDLEAQAFLDQATRYWHQATGQDLPAEGTENIWPPAPGMG